jgi:AraC-like DNA-binding protein
VRAVTKPARASSAAAVEFDTLRFGIERRKPYRLPRQHAHSDVEMVLTESGELTQLLGGRRLSCAAGELTAFWAGIPHQPVSIAKGTICYFVHFPVSWLLEWRLPSTFVRSLLGGEAVRCPPALVALARERFRTWCDELAAGSAAAASAPMVLELEALVRRMAHSTPAVGTERPPRPAGAGRSEQIAAYLVQHYARRLTAAQVAAAAGIHPNYAMRVFARTFGISLWEYVGRLRVAHARYLLDTTDLKVIDVAAQSGFTSVGRFYTVFGRHTGTTPHAFRLGSRGGS